MKRFLPIIMAIVSAVAAAYAGAGSGQDQNLANLAQQIGAAILALLGIGGVWKFGGAPATKSKDIAGVTECVKSLTDVALWASSNGHQKLNESTGIAICACHEINLDTDVPAGE